MWNDERRRLSLLAFCAVGLVVFLAAVFLASCGNDTGTSATPVPPPPTITSGGTGASSTGSNGNTGNTGNTPTTPTTPTNTDTSRGDYLGAKDGKVGAVLENLTDGELLMGFACYAGPHNDPGAQRMPDPKKDYYVQVKVKGGDDKEVWVKEPCGKYQCDAFEGEVLEIPWYGSRLIFGRLGTGKVNCGSDEPKCPGNAYAKIDAKIPISQTETVGGGCPETYPVTWTVDTNLPNHTVTLPPEVTQTGPNTGTVPGKEQPYMTGNFHVDAFMANGLKCAWDDDQVSVPGCQCEACVDSHLNHEIIYHEQATCEGQKVTVKVSSSHPGEAHIGGNTEYFAAGNHEWTYNVDCGQTMPVMITNYDDHCGEKIQCGAIKDLIEIECPECCDEHLKVNAEPLGWDGLKYGWKWNIDASSSGVLTVGGGDHNFPAGVSSYTEWFECKERTDYDVPWSAVLDNECEKDGGSVEIPKCPCSEPMLVSWDGCRVKDNSGLVRKLEGWGNAEVRGAGHWKLCLVAYKTSMNQLVLGDAMMCHEGPKDCDEGRPDCWENDELKVHWKTHDRTYARDYDVRLELFLNGALYDQKNLGPCN